MYGRDRANLRGRQAHGLGRFQNGCTAPSMSAEETAVNPSKLPCGPDESDFELPGTCMLASRSFWVGGALSVGIWSILLHVALQA